VFDELVVSFSERQFDLNIHPLPHCYGDASMLHQVWVNLLGNAIKFTRPQAIAQIEVTGHAESEEIIYCIKDNGAGFDMQNANKLFGVFQRLHGVTEFEGTGVGLAIVKRIITAMVGRCGLKAGSMKATPSISRYLFRRKAHAEPH
jgi:light-regulated signal transduction histidine kinase (bacteriophytochrome)